MPHGSPTSRLLPGHRLYKYQLLRRIGEGSFGEVWLAIDKAVDHEYAIKILEPGTPVHERLREARIGHKLNHPNVVRVHQADVMPQGHQQFVVLAMDFIEDGPVTTLANPSGYLTLPEVVRLGRDVLRGLEYLHGIDLIHNDIKPENVLIGPEGQGMLTDYGIVGFTQGSAPIPASMFYKMHAAPEVISANMISQQSDVYQVGLTLFRMLVGLDSLRRKFNNLGEQGYFSAVSSAGLVKTTDFPAYVPPRLRRIVQRAVHLEADRRYPSALAMRRELEKLNYPGFWTVTESGDFLGCNGSYLYRFEQATATGGKFNVQAYKKSASTKRETRLWKYCHKSLPNGAAKKAIEKFVRAVVDGSL